MACGIFPNQGLNLCSLHGQANSQLLGPQGSPTLSLVDRSSCPLALWLGASAVILLLDQCLGFGPVGHPWSVILLFGFLFFFFMFSLLGIYTPEPTRLLQVHGIFQARILEWVAISFSKGSSCPGAAPASPTLANGFFITKPPGKPHQSFYPLQFILNQWKMRWFPTNKQ